MKKIGTRFAFEVRRDIFDTYGILEEIKIYPYKGYTTLNIITGIDTMGNIIKPVYKDRIYGFKPLVNLFSMGEDAIQNFLNSKRAVFIPLGERPLIVDAIVKMDANNMVDKEKSTIDFYVPDEITIINGEDLLLCTKITQNEVGVNVPTHLYNSYLDKFISQLNGRNLTTKSEYLKQRVF